MAIVRLILGGPIRFYLFVYLVATALMLVPGEVGVLTWIGRILFSVNMGLGTTILILSSLDRIWAVKAIKEEKRPRILSSRLVVGGFGLGIVALGLALAFVGVGIIVRAFGAGEIWEGLVMLTVGGVFSLALIGGGKALIQSALGIRSRAAQRREAEALFPTDPAEWWLGMRERFVNPDFEAVEKFTKAPLPLGLKEFWSQPRLVDRRKVRVERPGREELVVEIDHFFPMDRKEKDRGLLKRHVSSRRQLPIATVVDSEDLIVIPLEAGPDPPVFRHQWPSADGNHDGFETEIADRLSQFLSWTIKS